MDRIGIIAAMHPEFEILQMKLENQYEDKICGIKFYSGMIGNVNVVLCECGVGKVNAAMAATIMIHEYECKLLINTGIAGGVGLKTKDVVIASKLKYYDFDTTIFGYEYGQVPGLPKEFVPSMDSIVMVKSILNKLNIDYISCPVYSGDQFVSKLSQLENIEREEVCACEMEGASVAQVAVRSGVDFIVLRYISDCVGEENQVNDYLAFEKEMAERSANICLQLMNNL